LLSGPKKRGPILPEFGSRGPITLDRYTAIDLPLKKTWRSWSAYNLDRLRRWTRGLVQSPIQSVLNSKPDSAVALTLMKEYLLDMAANMSSSRARAPFTVLLTMSSSSFLTSSSLSRCRRQPTKAVVHRKRALSHDETTLSSETCPSSLHHTAALYQCHGAVSSARDCRVSA